MRWEMIQAAEGMCTSNANGINQTTHLTHSSIKVLPPLGSRRQHWDFAAKARGLAANARSRAMLITLARSTMNYEITIILNARAAIYMPILCHGFGSFKPSETGENQ